MRFEYSSSRIAMRILFCYGCCCSFIFVFALSGVFGGASDADLLNSFRNALGSRPPPEIASWSPAIGACSFPGASCDGAGRVISLSLDSYALNAAFVSVAEFLLPLSALRSLSLRETNLTGEINGSTVISGCGPRLGSVDLSSNNIRGSVAGAAAIAGACGGLAELNLSSNTVGGGGASFSGEASFNNLHSLDLSGNSLASSTELRWLFLAGGENLRFLSVAGNSISGVLPAITNCSSLRFLDISGNSLTGDVGEGVLSNCQSLVALNMSSNRFIGSFPADIIGLSSLEAVILSNNSFSGLIPADALRAMGQLKVLQLSFNNFSGSIPNVAAVASLQTLDFSSNSLSGPLPSALCSIQNTSLQVIYLQDNFLTGSVPEALANCSSLVSLDLSLNYLNGSIPASLGTLSNLEDLIMWQNLLVGEIPPELGNIGALENLILDYNGLTGSIPPELVNCSRLNWISLASNQLSGPIPPWIGQLGDLAILKLGNNTFSGSIPPEIGDCKSLVWLDLNTNLLSGSIPGTLAKQSGKMVARSITGKRFVYLRNDEADAGVCHGTGSLLEFDGIRSDDLTRLPSEKMCNFTRRYIGNLEYTFSNNGSMIFLDLSYNQLSGDIPKELGTMFYLMIMNLGHNLLSGEIPTEFGDLAHVAVLDLSHNELEGPIPASFSTMSMSEVDFSNNRLNGSIPELGSLATFPKSRYENNSGLCGLPLLPCTGSPGSEAVDDRPSHRQQASIAGSIAMGLLFSLFCIIGLVIIVIESRKHKKNDELNGSMDVYIDSRSHSATLPTNWKLSGTNALSINLATFDKPLQKLTFADLLEATNGFHNDSLVGSGGFGDVYRAQLKDGRVVAIKKLIHVSGQGDREFTAEMETIGKIKHRNLVPLLGYCKVGEERLLVYDYMKYGSLEDVLHDRRKAGIKLNWAARRKIAVGTARGLAFLHHNCIPRIIHRDMKSSNVLLDDQLEARVSDFGMARLVSAMDTHLSVSTLAGTPGYVPPEYYQSFQCTTKGDVYSYGVVLLELLTGRPPTDSVDFGEDNNLVGWVKQHTKLRIVDVFDRELMSEDPTVELELLEHLQIACLCLNDKPSRRPTMLKVMAMFREIQARSVADSNGALAVASFDDGGLGISAMSLNESEEKD